MRKPRNVHDDSFESCRTILCAIVRRYWREWLLWCSMRISRRRRDGSKQAIQFKFKKISEMDTIFAQHNFMKQNDVFPFRSNKKAYNNQSTRDEIEFLNQHQLLLFISFIWTFNFSKTKSHQSQTNLENTIFTFFSTRRDFSSFSLFFVFRLSGAMQCFEMVSRVRSQIPHRQQN